MASWLAQSFHVQPLRELDPESQGQQTLGVSVGLAVNRVVTYGTMKLREVSGYSRSWKWHDWGSVFWLSVDAFGNLLPLASSLLYIVYLNVDRHFIWECHRKGRPMPFVENMICEYTTPFVRDFPAVGTYLALNIVARRFAVQRLFYTGIRHGIFVDFVNTSLWDHHQVFLVIFYLVHILVHHAVGWHCFMASDFYDGNYTRVTGFYTRLFRSYVLPIFLFITFAITQYGFEDYLLPLSRYLEENPRLMYKSLGRLQYIPESVCDKLAAENQLVTLKGETSWDYFYSLIKKAKESGQTCKIGTGGDAGDSDFEDPVEETPQWKWLSWKWMKMFMFSSWWPTHILLDAPLVDEDSKSFRRAWAFYHFVALLVSITVVVLYSMCIQKESQDLDGRNLLQSAWEILMHWPVILLGLVGTGNIVYQIYRGLR